MIWIDLENRQPTDDDVPGWVPWSAERWADWLAKSSDFVEQLRVLDAAGQIADRNKLIDDNSGHWGALKPWLQALSHGKCWFSEVRDLYAHYDVEHFRPKKEAKALNGEVRDGYWWLAFDYTNLRLCGNVGNRKKGGWFPLRDGSLCSTYNNQCEEAEFAFLLDPILSDDVALLAFDEEGKAVAVPGASPWDQERVNETVKRLKLNEHVPLHEARRKVLQKVNALIIEFDTARAKFAKFNNPAAKAKAGEIAKQLRELTRQTEELSAVARWCVIVRNDPRLSRLVVG
jgi:uncharacterized protein (TIGR02646 family)